MKKFLFLLMLIPFSGFAHPGVGIVKDSKGNIFYTDLKDVWIISKDVRRIVVPDVHSHELYIDENDNLFGEGGDYDASTKKFYHYLWVYRADGKLDTVVGRKQAYLRQNFSLARDKHGNEYYTKGFLTKPETGHIYRKLPDGKETIFAKGDFKGVTWLHPQDDGSLLYVSGNAIYKIDSKGSIQLVKGNVGNEKPSFKFSGNSITIWGVWLDSENNIYAAVFSDQTIRKIDPQGGMTDIFKSTGSWTPLHGVFDDDNKLWVLEGSDKNEVRVTLAEAPPGAIVKDNELIAGIYFVIGFISLVILFFAIKFMRKSSAHLAYSGRTPSDVRR